MGRILIVEDERSVAAMLVAFLDELGYASKTVVDGIQALKAVEAERPSLIIMDLMMPRMTGGEAARILKREPETAVIPILAISGVDHVEDLADVLPVDAILVKPFDLHDLNEIVTELLHTRPGGAPWVEGVPELPTDTAASRGDND